MTTVGWVLVTLVTPPTSAARLASFYELTRPGGPGWRRVAAAAETGPGEGAWAVPRGLLAMLLGSLAVYAALFATGYALYGEPGAAAGLAGLAVVCGLLLARGRRR